MKYYKKLFKLSVIYSIGSLSEKAISFFLIPLYTLLLSPKDYGIVGIMSVTVSLLTSFFFSPLQSGFVRHYYAPEYVKKRELLVFNIIIALFFQSLIMTSIFFLFSNNIAKIILDDSSLTNVIQMYSVIIFIKPISMFFLNIVRMKEKAVFFVFNSLTKLIFVTFVIIYLLKYKNMKFYSLIYGELVGVVYTFLICIPFILKNIKLKFKISILKPIYKYGYPMTVASISNSLLQIGDRYVIAFFNSISKVGLYSFGYSFAGIINLLFTIPLKNAINPIAFKQEKDPEQLKKFLINSANYFYFISSYCCLILSFFGEYILQFMVRNDDYLLSWPIVPIIAFSYVQHGLGNIVGKGISLAKKSFYMSSTVIVAAISNILLNFIFVPYWGIMGAAFATLISYLIWNYLKIYYSAKFYNLYFEIKKFIFVTILSLIYCFLTLFVFKYFDLWLGLASKTILIVIYPLIFLKINYFSDSEKKYLYNFLKEMKNKITA